MDALNEEARLHAVSRALCLAAHCRARRLRTKEERKENMTDDGIDWTKELYLQGRLYQYQPSSEERLHHWFFVDPEGDRLDNWPPERINDAIRNDRDKHKWICRVESSLRLWDLRHAYDATCTYAGIHDNIIVTAVVIAEVERRNLDGFIHTKSESLDSFAREEVWIRDPSVVHVVDRFPLLALADFRRR